MADKSRGLARRRVQLSEKYNALTKEEQEFCYELRCSFLIDMRKFNIGALQDMEGIFSFIPSPIVHFESAEKQRSYQRQAKQKKKDMPE